MIIFQLPPCRLYPKICKIINEQIPDSVHIHEVFELSDEKFYNNPNNTLGITPKNFTFPRSQISFGIFDINKIEKKPSDFHLTIKFKKKDLIREYFAGLRYYGSLKFYKKISNDYEKCLFNLLGMFNDFSDEEVFKFIKEENAEKILTHEDISYNFRKELLNQDGDFDYIGSFDDWNKTIQEIKEKIGLDLTGLKEEKTKSYKE